METYSAQVMELLSLGKTSDGVNRIEVVVTHEDRQAIHMIDIDEFTFVGLEAIKPLDGGRARLSPYPKWDPYRKTYYCSIIRSKDRFRETLYFHAARSSLIRSMRMWQAEPLPVVIDGGAQDRGKRKMAGRRVTFPPFLRQFPVRVPRMAKLLVVMYGLSAVLSSPYEGKEDPIVNLSGQVVVAKAVEATDDYHESIVTASTRDADMDDVIVPAPVVTEQLSTAMLQSDANEKDYEVVDIDGDKKFFGLPKNYVALTFDDGPSLFTNKIVDILRQNKIAATFLFVGKNAKRNPEAVVYASERGMSIGNHSWDHCILTKLSSEDQNKNLSRANSVLESLTGTSVTLFRPTYGSVNDDLVSSAKKQHMKTLLWNRDPEDWNAKKPEDILRYFHGVEASGAVYVLHENKNTVQALPEIIEYLKGKNLKFVIFK